MAMGIGEAGPIEGLLTGPEEWRGKLAVACRFPPKTGVRTQFYSSHAGTRFAKILVHANGTAAYVYVSPWFGTIAEALEAKRRWPCPGK